MELELWKLIVLCVLMGFAAFVDAVAGGGGVISVPAYLALGFPPHFALGNSKVTSMLGSTVSVLRYAKRGKICWPAACAAGMLCIVGSWIGAKAALALPEKQLQVIMMVVLPLVAVVMLVKKRADTSLHIEIEFNRRTAIKCGIIGLIMGGYEGLIGPGTGTFLVLLFSLWVGYDILTASGTSKMVNYVGTLTAGITMLVSGKVLIYYAVPTAICHMLGSYIGAGMALKSGDKIIRPMMIAVVIMLFAKMAFDFFLA